MWACTTCLRPAADARTPVPRCHEPANVAPGRCLYRTQQAAAAAAASAAAASAFVASTYGPREPDAAGAAAPDLELQLAKEKESRLALREQLRTTEALAAESQALRARMHAEMERMNGEIARLRAAAATAGLEQAAAPDSGFGFGASHNMTPLASPSAHVRRSPWLLFGLLLGLLGGGAGAAWLQLPFPASVAEAGHALTSWMAEPGRSPRSSAATTVAGSAADANRPAGAEPAAASAVGATGVALAASAPEDQLAANPPAAGTAAERDLPARLQSALAAEGVSAPVSADAHSGHVAVSDPAADAVTRERTDTVIRAVFAGANLAEPQIEHRWLSPPRAGHGASSALAGGPPAEVGAAAATAAAPARPGAASAAGKQVASLGTEASRRRHPEQAREEAPILPLGRVTAACKVAVANLSPVRRPAELASCMKRSCCNPDNRQREECSAYDQSHPLNCPVV